MSESTRKLRPSPIALLAILDAIPYHLDNARPGAELHLHLRLRLVLRRDVDRVETTPAGLLAGAVDVVDVCQVNRIQL